jgi:parallel beta-helix repeat protein
MTRISLVILALATGCCLALSPDEASANHVSCGETITADTTLDSDLLDCPDNGVVIGADDVTLDLNGHLIDGDGTCPMEGFCAGVLNDGHDRVTVSDGSVRQFDQGVVVHGSDNRVVGISAAENRYVGIYVIFSAHILVRDSSATDNGLPGIGAYNSHDVQIVHNSVQRNEGGGLEVIAGSDNVVKSNLASRNRFYGIYLGASDTQVRRNRFVGNRTGIYVFDGRRSVITRNRISRGAQGINIAKGRGNRVARNVIVRPHGYGLQLGFQRGGKGGDTIVRRNLVRKSGGDGFRVKPNHHGVLSHNVARRTRHDGFDIQSRFTKLTGNQAVRNGDLGIDAVAGVTDGGGNRAHGNGDPAQCKNVACK